MTLLRLSLLAAVLGASPIVVAVSAAAGKPVAARTHTLPALALDLLWVEPSAFLMGSPPDEPNRNRAEGAQRRVTLSRGFWLGKTEVTQAQYEAVTGSNPSTFKAAGPTAPVERVSWIDAMAFCRKLTETERAAGRLPEGYVFTLPTEAQWEYAYRAGTTGSFPAEPNGLGWFAGNSDNTTHPVAQKQPNPWGFYDQAGNVLEWCLDWYDPDPRGDASDPSGPSRGYYRVARGGSWRTSPDLARSAARAGGSAGRLDYTLGFRLALSPLPSAPAAP